MRKITSFFVVVEEEHPIKKKKNGGEIKMKSGVRNPEKCNVTETGKRMFLKGWNVISHVTWPLLSSDNLNFSLLFYVMFILRTLALKFIF